jgi:hypothetical protein
MASVLVAEMRPAPTLVIVRCPVAVVLPTLTVPPGVEPAKAAAPDPP